MAEIVTLEYFREFEKTILEKLSKLDSNQKEDGFSRWLKSNDVKQMLGISHGTLQQLRDNRTLKYCKVGGIIFYDRLEIEKYLEKSMKRESNK